MNKNQSVASRTPRGVVTGRPVGLRLMPDELAELEHFADDDSRSLASMARLIYLEGAKALRRRKARQKSPH